MAQKLRQDLSIGSNIRLLRKGVHLTQEQTVAKMQVLGCSITRSAYAQIEMGRYNIRIGELVALKSIFQTEYATFFAGLTLDHVLTGHGAPEQSGAS